MKIKKIIVIALVLCMVCNLLPSVGLPEKASAESDCYYGEVDGMPGIEVNFNKKTGTITYIKGDPVDVVIPSEIAGATVKVIGSSLFSRKETLESVTLPATIKEIGNCAFRHCYNLEKIVFLGDKSKIKYDGLFVFTNCGFFNQTFSKSYKKSKYYKKLAKVKLTGNYVKDTIKIAKSQLGYVESNSKNKLGGTGKRGNKNYCEYSYMLGKPDRYWLSYVKNNDRWGGWCGDFCVWCYLMAGTPEEVMNGFEMYDAMDEKGKSWKQTVYAGGKYKIKKGDIIHFEGGHYALVTSVKKKGKKVYIGSLNGNWINDVSKYTYKIDKKNGQSHVDGVGKLIKVLPVRMDKKKKASFVKLTFDPNGGSVSTKSKKVAKTSAYGILPTPKKSGYKFKGWYTELEGGKKIDSYRRVMLSEDTTVYARWA